MSKKVVAFGTGVPGDTSMVNFTRMKHTPWTRKSDSEIGLAELVWDIGTTTDTGNGFYSGGGGNLRGKTSGKTKRE